MTEAQALDYVKAAATALGLRLDAGRAQAVASHLVRTAAMAELLDDAAPAPENEPAEIYRPAPFHAGPDNGAPA